MSLKTNLLLTISAILLFFTSLNAQVPNSSFENWTGDSLNGWHFTYSVPGYENVFRSTDAAAGNYSVRLKPVYNSTLGGVARAGINTGFIPLTKAYESLNGNVKGTLADNDHFVVLVEVYQGGFTIGVGSAEITQSSSEWTTFSAPVNYASQTPDSVYIALLVTSSSQVAHEGTDYYVDNLHFEPTAGVDELKQTNNVALYPNPVTDKLTVDFTLGEPDKLTFSLVSADGNTIMLQQNQIYRAGENNFSAGIGELPHGIYLLRGTGEKYEMMKKIVVQR